MNDYIGKRHLPTGLVAAVAVLLARSGPIHAAAPQDNAAENGPLPLDEVIVTANPVARSKMRGSASVSTFDLEQIQNAAPTNTADILRDVPGILAQASGGEGNANITARGLPISGGAKLMQFQEDGLPVLDFGDIDFATADTFVKADYNLERLEVIRGGSAATLASNAPGGVFNFISKTGDTAGGHVGLSRGIDFDQTRVDFDYGAPLGDRWKFHFGGFYRVGEGPRTVGYTAENGGQIKGNITREFATGYIRLNMKLLHDRAPVYLPEPVSITGSVSDPQVASLPGFDIVHGALQSRYFPRDLSVDSSGAPLTTDLRDGYYSNSKAFGLETAFDLGNDWKLTEKFRKAFTSGRFVGPYPGQVNTAAALASQFGGNGATLVYATGPQAGQLITNPATLNGNGLALQTLLFNVTLNNLDNFANDIRLTKVLADPRLGATHLTLGYFRSQQKIFEDWHWNTYLEEVKGENAALLDVIGPQGAVVTQNGLLSYGEPVFGDCCIRSYRLRYDTNAPYVAVNWERGPFNVDGSLRYDIASATGRYAGSTGTTAFDVNGDGIIEAPEQNVPIVNNGASSPVDYTVHFFSYAAGGNYLLSANLALFAGANRGGRANAERMLFGGGIRADGSIAEQVAVDTVKQVEAGLKWRNNYASLFATYFHASTQVTDQDITSVKERFVSRLYVADGLELEGFYERSGLRLRGGLTYTLAKIAADQITPQDIGLHSSPRFLYQFTPEYRHGILSLGLTFIGTSAFPSVTGGFSAPGFVQTNVFATCLLGERLTLSVTGNNIFNQIGITEINGGGAGAAAAAGVNTARSIDGRTFVAFLRYAFP